MAYTGTPYRPGTTQVASYTSTAGVITNPVGAGITCVRVVLTTAGHIAIGAAPTATTSNVYMPAGIPEYFQVREGEKVSAIQVASGGNLHVTEMTR